MQNDPTRRRFLQGSLAAAAGAGLTPVTHAKKPASAAAVAPGAGQKLVGELYASLDAKQRKQVCLPIGHKLRGEIDNNWHITKTRLSKDFTPDQQQMVKEIFIGLHDEEYAEAVLGQVEQDGGFGTGSIAIFGEPGDGSGKFQFVYTGRHCTRRLDGGSEPGAAFGGPIFYGHAADGFNEGPDHKGNAYWFQAERANAAFQLLDGKQREKALIDTNRREKGSATIELTGKFYDLPGIPMSDLTRDQQEEVGHVIGDLLAPFREADRVQARTMIEQNGFENLHLSFSKNRDIGKDKVWDVWEIQGPHMIWYFRGDPHVHTWAHIREGAKEA